MVRKPKIRFDLEPHIGAGDLKLGMTRAESRAVLGTPYASSEKDVMVFGDISIPAPAKDSYFENELQVTFDDDHRVNFMEFCGRQAEHIEVYFNGIDVFKTPAQQLIQEISTATQAHYDEEDEEIPYAYVFPSIDLTVWRDDIPEQEEQQITILESEEGKYFWTIGIGVKGYCSSIREQLQALED